MRHPPGLTSARQIVSPQRSKKEISVCTTNACTPTKADKYRAQEPMARTSIQVLICPTCWEANRWRAPALKGRFRSPAFSGGTHDEIGKCISQTGSPPGSYGQHHRCPREGCRSLAEALALRCLRDADESDFGEALSRRQRRPFDGRRNAQRLRRPALAYLPTGPRKRMASATGRK